MQNYPTESNILLRISDLVQKANLITLKNNNTIENWINWKRKWSVNKLWQCFCSFDCSRHKEGCQENQGRGQKILQKTICVTLWHWDEWRRRKRFWPVVLKAEATKVQSSSSLCSSCSVREGNNEILRRLGEKVVIVLLSELINFWIWYLLPGLLLWLGALCGEDKSSFAAMCSVGTINKCNFWLSGRIPFPKITFCIPLSATWQGSRTD